MEDRESFDTVTYKCRVLYTGDTVISAEIGPVGSKVTAVQNFPIHDKEGIIKEWHGEIETDRDGITVNYHLLIDIAVDKFQKENKFKDFDLSKIGKARECIYLEMEGIFNG